MRKTSKIIIVTIIATSILLGLGYAAIQNITLNILGTAAAQISQDNFKVRFVGTPVVSDAVNVTANINNDTTASINVTGLTERGQSVTATYEIENQSEDLSTDLKISTTNSNTEYFRVSSRLDEMSLVAGDKTTVTVTVEMLKTPIEESVSSNVGVILEAMPVEPGKEGTSEGINDFSQTPNLTNEYGFYYREAYTINYLENTVTFVFMENGEGAIFYNDVLAEMVPVDGFKYDTLAVDLFGEGEYAKFSADGRELVIDESDGGIAYLDESFVDKFDSMIQEVNEYGFHFGKMYSIRADEDTIGSIMFYEDNTVAFYTNGILDRILTGVEYSENQAEYEGDAIEFYADGLLVDFNGAMLCLDITYLDTYEILEEEKNEYGFYYEYPYSKNDDGGLVSVIFHENKTISIYVVGALAEYWDEEIEYSNNRVSSDGILFNVTCDGKQVSMGEDTFVLDYEYVKRLNDIKEEKNEYGFYFEKPYSVLIENDICSTVFYEDGSATTYINGNFEEAVEPGIYKYSLNTIIINNSLEKTTVENDGLMITNADVKLALDLYFEDRLKLME